MGGGVVIMATVEEQLAGWTAGILGDVKVGDAARMACGCECIVVDRYADGYNRLKRTKHCNKEPWHENEIAMAKNEFVAWNRNQHAQPAEATKPKARKKSRSARLEGK